jgi:hypothetical protein
LSKLSSGRSVAGQDQRRRERKARQRAFGIHSIPPCRRSQVVINRRGRGREILPVLKARNGFEIRQAAPIRMTSQGRIANRFAGKPDIGCPEPSGEAE